MTTRREFLVGSVVLGAGALASPSVHAATGSALPVTAIVDASLAGAHAITRVVGPVVSGAVDLPAARRVLARARHGAVLGVTRYSDRVLFEQLAFESGSRFALLVPESDLSAMPPSERARMIADGLGRTALGASDRSALATALVEAGSLRAASIWVVSR